jgi:general secretion pathway protein A
MFLQYYGLREQPFGVTPNPRFLYFSATHREALASLFYGIESGCGFLTLIAPPGMGKTTLLFHLLEKLRGSAQTVFLFQTQCGSREFFRYLLTDLGADASEQNLARMHESLNAVLLRNARVGRRVILVIDEAQNLEDSVLETVRLLSDFETPQAKLLQIVLAGQPQLADKLSHPALAQLRQRISIVSRLHPFTRVEVMVYLEYRLRMAGYSGGPLFRYDAAELITAQSGGIPRIINNICFNALTLGFAKRQKQTDAAIVSEVLADLDIEGLGTHPLAPGRLAQDSLSSFDGLSPTDDSSYQEFHNAVCTAWEKGTPMTAQYALMESGPVHIKSGDKNDPVETNFQAPVRSQNLPGSPFEMDRESTGEAAAQFASLSAPQFASQVPRGSNSHGAPQQEARGEAEEGSLALSSSEETAPRSENRKTRAAISSLLEVHGATHRPADKQQSQEPAKPNFRPLSVGTQRIGIWARALSKFSPYAQKKVEDVVNKRRTAIGRTMIVVAFVLAVGGVLFVGRFDEIVHLKHDSILDTSRSNSMNPVTESSAIDSIKISQEAREEKPTRSSRTREGKPTVITLESGETLSGLSFRYLGRFDPEVTQQIQMLNPKIMDPDRIFAGTQVRLPAPPDVFDRSASLSGVGSGMEEHSR